MIRISDDFNASLPEELLRAFEGLDDDPGMSPEESTGLVATP